MPQQAFTPKLNCIAEFTDKALETDYFQKYMDSSKIGISIFIMILGVFYFALAFFDRSSISNQNVLIWNLTLRAIVFSCGILSTIIVMKGKNTKSKIAAIMVFFVLSVVSYQFILFLFKSQDFAHQGMAFMLMVYAIFLIPNRWIYSLAFTIAITVLFLIVTPLYIKDVPVANMFCSPIGAIILSGTHAFYLNKYRRLQFYKEKQLEVLANTDRLTGIYNRKKFDEVFRDLIQVMDKDSSCFSIIMFDLDNFKLLNDTHGHMMGDKVLTACSDAVLKSIRAHEILARWGGEEFMILLPNTTLNDATNLAERLRQIIENLILEDLMIEDKVRVTASFGVTRHHEGDTMDTVIKRVDACLYHAKEAGRNCVSTEEYK